MCTAFTDSHGKKNLCQTMKTNPAPISTSTYQNAVLAYALIGLWLVFVCQAIGEIATLLPLPGAFNAWGARVFDEAFSFQMTVSSFNPPGSRVQSFAATHPSPVLCVNLASNHTAKSKN